MNEYKLYDGQVTLQFDPKEHKYFKDGNSVKNMTSITGIISNKDAMVGWSAKMCKLKFLEKIIPHESYDIIQLDDIAKQIQMAPRRNKENAGDIGTKVHEHIENYLQYETEPKIPLDAKEEQNAYNCFKDWYDTIGYELKVESLERKVYSKKYNYTGTTDALFTYNKEYIIYDWKTSSGIFHSHLLQVTGYAMALEEELGIQINKGVIANFPKKGRKKLYEFDIDSTMRENFLACLKLYLMQERKV